ncbi:MAG: hypothetical protein AABZ60_18465 [Planctomycetota bacterium]
MFLDAKLIQLGMWLMIPELLIFGGVWVLMAFLLWNPQKREKGSAFFPVSHPNPTPKKGPRKRFPSFPSFIFKNRIF